MKDNTFAGTNTSQDNYEDLKKEEIMEKAHEIDDGALDTYMDDNWAELSKEFCCEDYNDEFREYCKLKFNETNK